MVLGLFYVHIGSARALPPSYLIWNVLCLESFILLPNSPAELWKLVPVLSLGGILGVLGT